MYLTGGQYKGRKVEVPNSAKPTLSKVRESIFNMLQNFDFKDNTFLDVCAGSAIMGLEAISRGYKATEIEINPKSANIIKKTYSSIGLKPDIIIADCLKFKTNKTFDIIYIDPPWESNYEKFILKAYELISEKGLIILEFDEKNPIDEQNVIKKYNLSLELIKAKKYGRCRISFLRKII